MSPLHPIIWLAAACFQVTNGIQIGGWLSGYGPITPGDWQHNHGRMDIGIIIFFLGLTGNIFHDEVLREIRRAELRKRAAAVDDNASKAKGGVKGVEKVYVIPERGLFRWIFYPHYLCEWIEWAGFYIMAGSWCIPARNFVLNEISTMLPRAVQGKSWYFEKFGKEKVAGRKAIIPGVL